MQVSVWEGAAARQGRCSTRRPAVLGCDDQYRSERSIGNVRNVFARCTKLILVG